MPHVFRSVRASLCCGWLFFVHAFILHAEETPIAFTSALAPWMEWEYTDEGQHTLVVFGKGEVEVQLKVVGSESEFPKIRPGEFEETVSLVWGGRPAEEKRFINQETCYTRFARYTRFRDGWLLLTWESDEQNWVDVKKFAYGQISSFFFRMPNPPPELVIPYRTEEIVIDGQLDEPMWEHAVDTRNFVAPYNPPDPTFAKDPRYVTAAKLCWDEDALYVAFRCGSDYIYANITERDQRLASQDVVEVYLDPIGDGLRYFEFHVSPLGTLADYEHTWERSPNFPYYDTDTAQNKAFGHNRGDPSFHLDDFEGASGRIAFEGELKAWTVEMRIPFAALFKRSGLPEKASVGQTLFLNLYRYAKVEDVPGHLLHRQLNWFPTRKGCPHFTPMALQPVRLEKAE